MVQVKEPQAFVPYDKPENPDVVMGESAEGAECDSDPSGPAPVPPFRADITPCTVGMDEIGGAGLPAVGFAAIEEETAGIKRRRTAKKTSDATSRVRLIWTD